MRRREFIALIGALGAWPSTVRAQQGGPVKRIGVLMNIRENDPEAQARIGALREGLALLGWVEGKNLAIEFRWSGSDIERLRQLAAELVNLGPEVLWSTGTDGTTALFEATKTIPVVFVNVTDPVAGGFVSSLSKPGGNITGFAPFEYDIGGKWLELLKDCAPQLARAGLFGDPANHNFNGFRKSFEIASKSLSVEPVTVAVRSADDINAGMELVGSQPNGGLVITAATFSLQYLDLIISTAIKRRLPAIYWNRYHVVRGGLMSFGPNIIDLHRQSASYVDLILKGAKAGDLPVQGPTKVGLVINLKTAKAIDLAIPPSLLSRADEVIE
jgi:putative ABC transport system substrate-binding protein